MQNISILEYTSWKKVILYSKLEVKTNDIKQVVNRLIWDKELEIIKAMPLERVQQLVSDLLDEKWLDLT